MGLKIKVGGDLCITSNYLKKSLFSEDMESFFQKSDLNILNLECPILEINGTYHKIVKTGPHLSTKKDIISHLKIINTDLVTAANNHILDYGDRGIDSTLKILDRNNIDYVGVGKNISDAQKYKVRNLKDTKIGIVNFCENEWSTATSTRAGANPLDLIDNLNQIKRAKNECNFVIVIIHGGHEYFNLPSPLMLKRYRFFSENGADVVIGHHTHCISGYEDHKGKPIFYGLGNMLFTKPSQHENWYIGLILELELEKGTLMKWEIHPVEQSRNDFQVNLLNGYRKNKVLKNFDDYSKIIRNDKELIDNWNSFTQSKMANLNNFSPTVNIKWNYLRNGLNRLGFNKIFLRKRYLTRIFNEMRCEAHYEVVTKIISNRIHDNDENSHS